MKKLLVLLLLLCAAFSACSNGAAKPLGAKGSPGSNATSPGGARLGAVDPKAFATPTPNATASPKLGVRKPERSCQTVRYKSATSGLPGGTYIIADPAPKSSWGAKCRYFRVGDDCNVAFNGSYSAPGSKAYLRFEAWLPKSKAPATSKLVGPVPAVDGTFSGWSFRFVVPDVDAVLFRIALLNDQKAEIADGDSFVYHVNCG